MNKRGYIPFAITEFGDVLCIKTNNGCVELYNLSRHIINLLKNKRL